MRSGCPRLERASLDQKWQARFIATAANSGTLIPETRLGEAFFSKQLFFQPVEDLQKRLNLWNEFKLGLEG